MDQLRHQNFKNKQTTNNTLELEIIFKPLDISNTKKEENIYKKHLYDQYDQFINYIPEPIKRTVDRVNDQFMSLYKTKGYSKPERVKTVYGGGKKQSQENIINSMQNIFKLKKQNEV